MAQVIIEDFRAGVDQSRPIHSAPQGTLWQGINGHLSRGGDFEQRKAFVETFQLATNTFGLQYTPDFVAATAPVTAGWSTTQHSSNLTVGDTTVTSVVSSVALSIACGNIARGSDAYYFECAITTHGTFGSSSEGIGMTTEVFDPSSAGSVLSGWDAICYSPLGMVTRDFALVATFATYTVGDVVGVAFDANSGKAIFYKNNSLQGTVGGFSGAWRPAVSVTARASTGAVGSFLAATMIYSPPAGYDPWNGVTAAEVSEPLLVFGSAATPAPLVTTVAGISSSQSIAYRRLQHYTVATAGTVTTTAEAMTAILSSCLFDGKVYAIAEYSNGDICHFYDSAPVSDWGNQFTVGDFNPVAFTGTVGTIAHTHRTKVYVGAGKSIAFSDKEDATEFTANASAGSLGGTINLSQHQAGSTAVTGLGSYQERLAIFARRVVQIWTMVDSPSSNAPSQIIENSGTRSPRSVVSFANYDVFYLSDSGIRSLRARDSSTSAFVNDVGVPIDAVVLAHLRTLSDAQIRNAVGIIEPIDGRFWLAAGNKIFVFSYFPSKKISGWTWYEPGISVTEFSQSNDRVWARAGNSLYLYGGQLNETYDSSLVTCWLPFMAFGRPATPKHIKGVDICAEGRWDIDMLVNPDDLSQKVVIGSSIGEVTTWQEHVPAIGYFPACSLKFTRQTASAGSLSQVVIHYMKGKDE